MKVMPHFLPMMNNDNSISSKVAQKPYKILELVKKVFYSLFETLKSDLQECKNSFRHLTSKDYVIKDIVSMIDQDLPRLSRLSKVLVVCIIVMSIKFVI